MDSHLGLKALRIAVPYIRAYKGRIFVIKLGGGLCRPGPALANLADQIAVLHQLGIKIVLVHGGGQQATALGRRLGIDAGDRRRAGGSPTAIPWKWRRWPLPARSTPICWRRSARRRCRRSDCRASTRALVTVHRRPVRAITDPSTGQTREVDFGFVGDVDRVSAKPHRAPAGRRLRAGGLLAGGRLVGPDLQRQRRYAGGLHRGRDPRGEILLRHDGRRRAGRRRRSAHAALLSRHRGGRVAGPLGAPQRRHAAEAGGLPGRPARGRGAGARRQRRRARHAAARDFHQRGLRHADRGRAPTRPEPADADAAAETANT